MSAEIVDARDVLRLGEMTFPSEGEKLMGIREWASTFRSYVGTIPRQCETVSLPRSMTSDASILVPFETIRARRRTREGPPL
jgi:hypothetical protein